MLGSADGGPIGRLNRRSPPHRRLPRVKRQPQQTARIDRGDAFWFGTVRLIRGDQLFAAGGESGYVRWRDAIGIANRRPNERMVVGIHTLWSPPALIHIILWLRE